MRAYSHLRELSTGHSKEWIGAGLALFIVEGDTEAGGTWPSNHRSLWSKGVT
jgi:hypothetical protein